MRVLAVLLLLFVIPAALWAEETPALPDSFAALGQGRVASVTDGDIVTLEDGREIRLVGIMAPKLSLGRPGFEAWPWAEESKAGLKELVEGQTVTLWSDGAARDRHGRVLAHLVRADDGLWVQGEMLRRGLARVYSFADNRTGVPALYRWEQEARSARRGMWSHPDYAVVSADGAERAVRSFALVEGRVLKVAKVRSRTYLNFGDNWRRDFTVKVGRAAARLFDANSLDLTQFGGRLIRVRGWVKWENGPLIEVTHPEQVELIDQPAARDNKETEPR